MRRLFLQFYISVLIILICSGIIHFIIFSQRTSHTNFGKIEEAMSGGIRIAASELGNVPQGERSAKLKTLKPLLDFPASLRDESTVPTFVSLRLDLGHDAIMFYQKGQVFICSPIDRKVANGLLVFGPLPQVVGPSQTDIAIGLMLILSLVGVAIYLALRPVSRQLRLLEGSILKFARGNLGARAEEDPLSPTRELAQSFNLLADRTENLVRTQRELLQAVSHELRTPLSRINFGIDLARNAGNEDKREECFQAIESASQELDELVGELLRYVRLESDGVPLEFTEIAVDATVNELLEGQRLIHPRKQFEFESELDDHRFLRADATSFRRAVSNLLSNAAKHGKSRIHTRVTWSDDVMELQIEDNGPGIPDDACQRIFDPFVRLNETTKGVGLGLAVVRRILERHGASIQVASSETLGGAKMTVRWPNGQLPTGSGLAGKQVNPMSGKSTGRSNRPQAVDTTGNPAS